MNSGQELFGQRDQIVKSLNQSTQRAYDNGIEAAQKTMEYRIIRAQETARLRAEGIPMTIIETMVKGEQKVAKAEYEMNVAEVSYRASNENIMVQKKLLDSIQADINREYYRGDET